MKSWHRPLGIPLWLIIIAVLLFLLTRHAMGATVCTGAMKPSFGITGLPPRLGPVNESEAGISSLS